MKRASLVGMMLAGVMGLSASSQAVIVINGTNATTGRNESAPTGLYANSGWDLQGAYGSFLGTPIAPDWFIAAAHVGSPGSLVTPDNVVHNVVETVPIGGTDLVLKRVSTPFTSFATLYDPASDGALLTSDNLIVFGRGTRKGSARSGGWDWGVADPVKSWGTNNPTAIGGSGKYLIFDFDESSGGDSEATVSVGDSSGAVFVLKNGEWRLVGINYAVELFYTAPASNTSVNAAIYDANGYYKYLGDANNNSINDAGDYQLITSSIGQEAYASYIPYSLSTIRSVIPEPTSLTLLTVGALALRRTRRH